MKYYTFEIWGTYVLIIAKISEIFHRFYILRNPDIDNPMPYACVGQQSIYMMISNDTWPEKLCTPIWMTL